MKRKKVAFLLPTFNGGGAQKVVLTWLEYLDQTRFEPVLIVRKKEGPLLSKVPQNITIIELHSTRIRYAIKALARVLNEHHFDTVFSTLNYMNVALLMALKHLKSRPKIIIREANVPSQVFAHEKGLRMRLVKRFMKRYYPKADLVIAQCDAMREDIMKTLKLNSTKVITLYNPIDLSKLPTTYRFNPYKTHRYNFLAVGKLTHQKGFDLLLEALVEVVKRHPNAHLTILGDGPLKENLTKQMRHLNLESVVEMKGYMTDVSAYFHYADAFVLSSRFEGFPNVLLEALAHLTPVVSTDCLSGPSEILIDPAYDGYLVTPNKVSSLVEGMKKMIEHPLPLSHHVSSFDVHKSVKKLEGLL